MSRLDWFGWLDNVLRRQKGRRSRPARRVARFGRQMRCESLEERRLLTGAGTLLAYDGFSSGAGPLDGVTDGSGWNTSPAAGAVGWYVQNHSTTVPGYEVNGTDLAYANLQTSGGSASGGSQYLTAGRRLDTTTTFAPYDVPGTAEIGANGTTLWLSALVNREMPVGGGQSPTSLDFNNSNVEWLDNAPEFGIGYYGTASDNGGVGYWSLQVGGNVVQSTAPVSVGRTALLVLEMNFSSTGDTFTLYVNPTGLGGAAPAAASAQLTGSNLDFSNLVYNAGSSSGVSTIADLRLGTSFAVVTPTASNTGPAPTTATNPGLLAYDGFDNGPGPLEDATEGSGWNTSPAAGAVGWYVQNNSTTVPGYEENGTDLAYSDLQTSGASASGGSQYLTAGRRLDTTTTFAPYDVPGTAEIGASGTTLWFSAVVYRQMPVGGGQSPTSLDFNNSNVEWLDNAPEFGIGYYGAASDNGGVGYWSLQVGGNVVQSATPVSVGRPALLVLEMNFSSTGDTFSLYVNPTALGGAAPAAASAQLTGSNLDFSNLVYNAGSSAEASSIADLRLGTSFAAVTPTGSSSQLTPYVSVSDSGGTYSSGAFAATTAVNGVSGLEGVSPTLVYYSGTSSTGTALLGAPTAVGTYTVVASFAGSADYTSGSGSTAFTIAPATPTLKVSDGGGTYDAAPFGASDSVAGVGSQSAPAASLEGISPSLTYYSGASATGSGSSAAPTAAGTYNVVASFAGSADYTTAAASTAFTIAKASPTITASPGPTVTLGTGATLTASAMLAGGYNESGSMTFTLYGPSNTVVETVTATVSGNGSYTTPGGYLPSVAGTYQWVVSYGGDGNHNGASTTKGSTPEVVVGGGSGIVGNVLYLVGGNANDQLDITPIGTSLTGSTGIKINGQLNGVSLKNQTYTQVFTAIDVVGFAGNDTFDFAGSLTIPAVISDGNGNDQIQLDSGNNTVTLGSGNDLVTPGCGGTLAGGNNVITAGNGNDQVLLSDGNNTVTLGNGCDLVLLGNGNNVVTVGNGSDQVLLGDGNNTVTLGTSSGTGCDLVLLGNGNNTVTGGNGSDSLLLGSGNNTVTLGNGNDNLLLGSGNNTVTLGNGNDLVWAACGAGDNTVTVGNGNDQVQLGDGNNLITAGTGNDCLQAGDGANTVVAGAAGSTGRIQVQLGNGLNGAQDTVTLLGNGNDQVQVGNGNNAVVTITGNGNDQVQVGNGKGDSVTIVGSGSESVQTGSGTGTVDVTSAKKTVHLGSSGWTVE